MIRIIWALTLSGCLGCTTTAALDIEAFQAGDTGGPWVTTPAGELGTVAGTSSGDTTDTGDTGDTGSWTTPKTGGSTPCVGGTVTSLFDDWALIFDPATGFGPAGEWLSGDGVVCAASCTGPATIWLVQSNCLDPSEAYPYPMAAGPAIVCMQIDPGVAYEGEEGSCVLETSGGTLEAVWRAVTP